ncbi:efflux RND transporter permease subunit [Octadecabacter sp. G9-8]|uniref:Efflux RND transporter permease subunit n=1 Tax=Octadecabacter dasysiphoniae TaxID=2909341 RepID=A0ABS9CUD3_9RHOB|nr:efflux RND transporter permease subunit [Octadecabacter dasysiphoniae]MCF2870848.1 efflux RND transporter permease subunit [Octadecabacter dasysiphoniae]
MKIARFSIEYPIYTWLFMLFALIGGAVGYLSVGKLEDPTFTLKSALVITPYPGATAAEVATEISEVLEAEIQQMDEIKTVTSRNTQGSSVIEVEVKDQFGGDELPQIWDDLRDRVEDASAALPNGALPSIVNDDFGDVFGILYAVSAPGFSDAEIWDIATFMRRDLLTVEGVANVEIQGLPEEAIFVEPSSQIVSSLGIDPGLIIGAISASTAINPTGFVSNGSANLRIQGPSAEDSVSEISGLTFGFQGEVLNLLDIAEVSRGRVDDPEHILRHNGQEVFTLGVSGLLSENIVTVGQRVEAELKVLEDLLPVGVTVTPIYEQHRVVDDANNSFLLSLAMSVGVVIGVLALFMGPRAAIVVGVSLLLTVTSTFFFMYLFDVKVERISLGALIIAMGMLVDNGIVIAEGMQQEMRKGRSSREAADTASKKTQIPLLGATIIGIMAFAGIGLSPDATGEFMFSLFAVIAISLLLSWFVAVTVTPLLGHYLFKTGGLVGDDTGYDGPVFRAYGDVVRWALKLRWLVIAGLIGTTVACVMAFAQVKQQFFPPATTPLFYLEYKAAQGTAIGEVSNDLEVIEDWLLARDDVADVTATIGQGLTRFILTYNPARADSSYGQLVIRATSPEAIPALRAELDQFGIETLPWAELQTKRIIYGPPVSSDIEARFSGPDPDVLRALATQAEDILRTATPLLHSEHSDWREREIITRPIYAEDRAQAAGIARSDVANAIALATNGIPAGTFRERDRLIDIVVRTPRSETARDGQLLDQIVYSNAIGGYLPLSQVIDGFAVVAENPVIERRNRVPTITVQANVIDGLTPPTVFGEIRPLIEAIDLPVGYRLEWGGEFESAGEAQASLGRQMPLAFGTMLLITVLLFGKLRQTAVIWTIVPMAINGVALGLLYANLAFSFTAMLGLLSLSGMLIKNAIVLVEEIDAQKADGLPQDKAIITASVSRLRPVVLAAGTTILGMLPLLADGFFAAMAVTIMGGLGFASILTLIGVPVLYHTYLRKERRADKRAASALAVA